MQINSKETLELRTILCTKEKPVLADDGFKNIIIESLDFLTKTERAAIHGFVIMNDHLHVLWQIREPYRRDEVQRDFLKFTAQKILRKLRENKNPLLNELLVQARDRKYQVWKRNSTSIEIDNKDLALEKLKAMHDSPVNAGLCKDPAGYKYSSAGFYQTNSKMWDFLVPLNM